MQLKTSESLGTIICAEIVGWRVWIPSLVIDCLKQADILVVRKDEAGRKFTVAANSTVVFRVLLSPSRSGSRSSLDFVFNMILLSPMVY
jgi:hypothetical protein